MKKKKQKKSFKYKKIKALLGQNFLSPKKIFENFICYLYYQKQIYCMFKLNQRTH